MAGNQANKERNVEELQELQSKIDGHHASIKELEDERNFQRLIARYLETQKKSFYKLPAYAEAFRKIYELDAEIEDHNKNLKELKKEQSEVKKELVLAGKITLKQLSEAPSQWKKDSVLSQGEKKNNHLSPDELKAQELQSKIDGHQAYIGKLKAEREFQRLTMSHLETTRRSCYKIPEYGKARLKIDELNGDIEKYNKNLEGLKKEQAELKELLAGKITRTQASQASKLEVPANKLQPDYLDKETSAVDKKRGEEKEKEKEAEQSEDEIENTFRLK